MITSCLDCTANAAQVLLAKASSEIKCLEPNDYTLGIFNNLCAASALVDDIVEHAKMLEDQLLAEYDEVESETTMEDTSTQAS